LNKSWLFLYQPVTDSQRGVIIQFSELGEVLTTPDPKKKRRLSKILPKAQKSTTMTAEHRKRVFEYRVFTKIFASEREEGRRGLTNTL
jgi:hypothetical protein